MRTDKTDCENRRIGRKELTALYEKHSPAVFRLCMSYLRDVSDSADAVQETFLRFISSDIEPGDDRHAIGWLIVTAGHICKDMLRRRKRRQSEPLDLARSIGTEERAFADTEVFDAVCALPEKYKTVVFLFYYEDMTTAQISAATGIKQSTVTSLLTRARRLLKKALGGDDNG